MKRFIALSLALSCTLAPGYAYADSSPITRAPERHTEQQIRTWAEQALKAANPSIELELMGVESWATYVNDFHFVPPTAEGHPADFRYDFNWVRGRRGGLPSAEITETGKFILWWEVCNYYGLPAEPCANTIQAIVAHEARHFEQWQRIAVDTIHQLTGETPQVKPARLSAFADITGAVIGFLRVWSDVAHYQCREIEAYMPDLKDAPKVSKLDTLKTYYIGCKSSRWAEQFAESISQLEALAGRSGIPLTDGR